MAKATATKLSLEEILSTLSKDKKARQAVTKYLAKEHSKEYLQLVSIQPDQLRNISSRFIASDKEWQE